jgi:hypothetical protein
MKLPTVHGTIRRRLLLNFRVDPEIIERELPPPFVPKLQHGNAIAGVCLIRLEAIRPHGFPRAVGFASENAAHRIAVEWRAADGSHEGVFIPRRDTNSLISQLAGGRVFPGEHHAADFEVLDIGGDISLSMAARDGDMTVRVSASIATALPTSSCFSTVMEASGFFQPGSLGYSVTSNPDKLHGVILRTKSWHVEPLEVHDVYSSYFADESRFPKGTIVFDHGLIMRDIEHEWHGTEDLYLDHDAS